MMFVPTPILRSVAPPGAIPVIAVNGLKTRVGVNAYASYRYSREPAAVNLLRGCVDATGATGFTTATGGTAPTFGTDRWPTSDFATVFHLGPTGSSFNITCQFTGKALVTFQFQRGASSLSAVSYNSGTNTSSFTFTFDPSYTSEPASFDFKSTQKTNASATNTGISALYFWKDANVGNTTDTWTAETVTYYSDFAVLRTMDMQSTNNDSGTTTWASRNLDPCFLGHVEDCISLGTACGKDLWMQIPVNATSDWDNNFFTYALANFSGVLHFGYSNENWNNGFNQGDIINEKAAIEMRGGFGDNGYGSARSRKIVSASRTSNVTTVTLTYTNDLGTTEAIYVTGMGATGAKTLIDQPTTTTFRYSDTGADGAITIDSSSWFISMAVSSTLRSFDNTTNLYAMGDRWASRRIVDASDRCRAIVGDSLMMTRFRPIREDWLVSADYGRELAYIAYYAGLSSKTVADKIYGIAGAPYWGRSPRYTGDLVCGSGESCAVHTVQDYADSLAIGAAKSKTMYPMGQRAVLALRYGIKVLCYEGGPDIAFDAGTTNLNNKNKALARYTSTVADAQLAFLKDLGMCNVDLYMHYNAEIDNLNTSDDLVWGYTYATGTVTSLWQSFKDYIALPNSAVPTLNALSPTIGTPTVIDARLYAGSFTATGSLPGFNTPTQYYHDMLVTATAGVYSVVINAACCNTGSKTFSVEVNGTVAYTGRTLVVTGTFPDLSTFADTTEFSLTLPSGLNSIRLVGVAQGADVAFKQWTITRTA